MTTDFQKEVHHMNALHELKTVFVAVQRLHFQVWKKICLILLFVVSLNSNTFAANVLPSSEFGFVTPQDFGTIGGVDDTTAIDAAFSYAISNNKCVYFPAQNTPYAYNGSGANMAHPCAFGDGVGSVINLGANVFLIDANTCWEKVRLENLYISGGAGAIRNKWIYPCVAKERIIRGNVFNYFTNAAISTNAPDDPFWKISDNHFYGDASTSIGIALGPGSDGSQIVGNNFDEYKIGIKIGCGGEAAHVGQNAFSHFGAGSQRANIWLVPCVSNANPNNGKNFTAYGNRHGNENLDTSDFAYLYADEGTGTYYGDRMPSLSASTNQISGGIVRDDMLEGTGAFGQSRPLVYSTTQNITSYLYENIIIHGTAPTYIVQMLSPISLSAFLTTNNNSIRNIVQATSNTACINGGPTMGSNFASLQSSITSSIYQNGRGAITGGVLQSVLLNIVNTINSINSYGNC